MRLLIQLPVACRFRHSLPSFLCCVCNIIFDDGAVILGFICAVYFIESIRQELIERLLISFFGEI